MIEKARFYLTYSCKFFIIKKIIFMKPSIKLDITMFLNIFLCIMSGIVLFLSFTASLVGDAIPCVFCLYQRHLYMTIFFVALFKILSTRYTTRTFDIILYIQLAIIATLFITAIYHSLIQRGILPPTEACILQMKDFINMYEIPSFEKTFCETGPKLIGIYSAEWSAIWSGLMLVMIYISFKLKKVLNF